MPVPTLLKKGSLVSNTGSSKEQKKLDEYVPIDYIMEWFNSKISGSTTGLSNRILVLKSDTGSGKSTAFPAILFDRFFKLGAGGIACTQPRIINAVTIVRDLTTGGFYPFLKLGENIGWQTGSTRKPTKYGLTFMTIGTLAMQLKTLTDDQIMNKYRFLIIDEVHEASLEQSMLLFILRNFLERNKNNPNLPFVVMTSATFDTSKFLKYFNVENEKEGNPNLIKVAGFTYKLITDWRLEKPSVNYINTAVDFVSKIHLENLNDSYDNADILIFMPGMGEIAKLKEGIVKLNADLAKKRKPVFMPLVIVGETVSSNGDDYVAVFASVESLQVTIDGKKHKPIRRVVLSTNVAETGVTIETLKYVIDAGFNRTPEYNPNFNASTLITKAATKAMVRQRMGRANRKSFGVFWPLYPKYVFDKLDDIQLGHIETTDVSSIVLSLLHEQVKKDSADNYEGALDISRINMLDTPPLDSLTTALEKLYILGFISPMSNYKYTKLTADTLLDRLKIIRDTNEETPKYNLTKMGAIAAKISKLLPEQIRMILAGYAWKASIIDLVTIAAWLSMDARDIKADPQKDPDWMSIYKQSVPYYYTGGPDSSVKEDLIYRIKLLIADDFMSGLFLFTAIKNIIKQCEKSKFFTTLKMWAENYRLNYRAIINFIQIREDIIENMLGIGLEPFQGDILEDQPEEIFIDSITKLKYCIYEGYRTNLAILDETKNTYVTLQNLPIKTPTIFTQDEIKKAEAKKYGITLKTKPKYILYDSISLKSDFKTNIYKASARRISTLDGFVKIDLTFSF